MPPKKKKAAINPIVVGTVSTRSTRRQSIVNIEIPKSNRTLIKNTFRSPTSGTPREYSAAENLSEKIKQTYNKMFNRILEPPSGTSLNQLAISKVSSSKFPESKRDSDSKGKSNVKSNEALLQILEDWTDDESQDDKKDSLDTETTDESEYVQQVINNSGNEGTMSDLVSMIQNQSVQEEIVSENETQLSPKQYEVPVEMHEYVQKEVELKIDTDEISKTGNSEESETEVIQEYIIEESEPVPIEEHVEEIVAFEEENIVECVTEEVVTDSDQYVLMDTAEDNTAEVFEINQQKTVSSEAINKGEIVNTVLPNQEKSVDENKEITTENFITEETSQSVSTTDSNDAEVRSFFAKEIENNKTVKEEDIPILGSAVEEQTNSGRENADSVGSIFEENAETETLVETGINNTLVSEEPAEESAKKSTSIEGNNKCELEKNSKEPEKMFLEENIKYENIVSNNEVVEPMDTTEDTTEDTIESKVAQMHLVDEFVKEEDTSDELSEIFNKSTVDLNYSLKEDIEEVIGVKACRKYSKELIKMEDEDELTAKIENKLLEDLEPSNEKPKTRRTRTVDPKSTQKDEEQSEAKVSKPAKLKEKRPVKAKENKSKESTSAKEPKNKKRLPSAQSVKKPKEKNEKKDIGKGDKKDTLKKTTKNDNDQLKKLSKSDNTDSEDTEVRRSSRIKSISVLKKKTTGHGLVRSKSEPVLNESDVSDSNSTHTESEKSTPSASPKVQLKDKKSRWTRSSDNLCDSQSIADSVMKGVTQLSEMMEVDEKPKLPVRDPIVTARLKQFIHLKENSYKTDRMICKEAKKMVCDCFLTMEEIEANEYGCGEDCLNRLLLIEWYDIFLNNITV